MLLAYFRHISKSCSLQKIDKRPEPLGDWVSLKVLSCLTLVNGDKALDPVRRLCKVNPETLWLIFAVLVISSFWPRWTDYICVWICLSWCVNSYYSCIFFNMNGTQRLNRDGLAGGQPFTKLQLVLGTNLQLYVFYTLNETFCLFYFGICFLVYVLFLF